MTSSKRTPLGPRRRFVDALRFVSRSKGVVARVGVVGCLLMLSGCGQLAYRISNDVPENFVPNPIELPPAEDQFVWLQVVDVIDDYFRIVREQPVQNSRSLVLDGRIETSYQVGGSILEPWRKDSTSGFERLQSTLQSIRRRAIVTVRPQPIGLGQFSRSTGLLESTGSGYIVEVIVQKDLEDTDRTQFATEATASVRHDGTIVRRADDTTGDPVTLGWIPLGRDTNLEQAILQDIFTRVTQPDTH